MAILIPQGSIVPDVHYIGNSRILEDVLIQAYRHNSFQACLLLERKSSQIRRSGFVLTGCSGAKTRFDTVFGIFTTLPQSTSPRAALGALLAAEMDAMKGQGPIDRLLVIDHGWKFKVDDRTAEVVFTKEVIFVQVGTEDE